MSNSYRRLNTAPGLAIQHPICEACSIEVDLDDEDWRCQSCGTIWPSSRMESDGSDATLYADWSGEDPGGVAVTVDDAWLVAGTTVEGQRDRMRRFSLTEWTETGA